MTAVVFTDDICASAIKRETRRWWKPPQVARDQKLQSNDSPKYNMKWIMTVLLALGGIVCCVNFYLSFLRYPVHRMLGKKKEEYRWISDIPVFGSLFVAISLFRFWQPPWLLATAIEYATEACRLVPCQVLILG